MRAIIACVLVGLLAAACGATSEHPLSDKTDSIIDKRLIGFWEAEPSKGAKKAPRMAIGRLASDASAMEMAWIDVKRETVKVTRIPFRATKIGNAHYVSVAMDELKDLGADSDMKGYALLKYTIEGGVLTMYDLDGDAVAAEIGKKAIAGTVSRSNQEVDAVHLTSSKAALRAWMAKAPAAIWTAGDEKLHKIEIGKK